jgi:hydrogenase maturation protein HypF
MDSVITTNTNHPVNPTEQLIRCRWQITGRVQGVGFRPLVYRLARRLQIDGAVWNDATGVIAEGQGTRAQLDEFLAAIRLQAPAAAVIRQITERQIPLATDPGKFQIRKSPEGNSPTAEIAADLAICPDCLAEIRDAKNRRRHGYALTNCTNCGPRFSIIRAIPYDRASTTMAEFLMCPQCQSEYENPADRRFHAQPTACNKCGPQLQLVDNLGFRINEDPIEGAARRLFGGEIVAIKGIGGYHLAVRADNQNAVARLRDLKHRPAKPFALMCASIDAARRLIHLSPAGEALIRSASAPIVLARRSDDSLISPAVAPGQHRLGVMLAYTPLHHLLFDELQPCGVDALVMTSGNDIDEPLVFTDRDALARLADLCDAILLHDRPIQRAVDDSVILDAEDSHIFLRRARGFVPNPVALPEKCGTVPGLACAAPRIAPGVAVGAEMKSTVAACRNGQAILSQHLGNLTRPRTFDAFKRAIADLCQLLAITPKWIAHDLHPGYLSTQYARQLAAQQNIPLIGVQHHHAHAAGVLAENGVTDPALAIVCDGTGYGADGTIWGGELLVADLLDFKRIGRIRPMLLPGGDACAKQPWRSAATLLYMAFGSDFLQLPVCRRLADPDELEFLRQMLATGVSCVQSSSTGRLFDGIAAMLNLCRENRFDAQAPQALEAAAASSSYIAENLQETYRLKNIDGLMEIDLKPLIQRIARSAEGAESTADLAMLFHQSLAAAWSEAIERAIQQTNLHTVALGGGVFCNELFARLLTRRLENLGARVLRHRDLPPNDGGIAFGQAAVAAARTEQTKNGFHGE